MMAAACLETKRAMQGYVDTIVDDFPCSMVSSHVVRGDRKHSDAQLYAKRRGRFLQYSND